ncbi:recombinase family protein [Nocardioides sp.]|uniref:recombinase family protein n=1 Tax=Nocardioides sp. TaxID=35761 RepID=UPI0025E015FF|nr:recombinase family protein [Nocardioides sp.]
MTTPRAAAIYARISSDPHETRAGVERQRQDCRAEAERLGWPLVDEYIDNDVSAYSGKPRPEYQRLLSDIEAGAVDALLVWHQDRLHRRPIELEHFFQIVDRAGISSNIRSVTGNADFGTGDGILVARITGAVSANESASKSRRILRKKEELAAAGLPVTGGRRPFGYTRDQLHVDPVEADIVRDLVRRFLAGDSVKSLTEWLSDTGIPTTGGGEWRTTTVRQIMTSPRIAGLMEHRGQVIGPARWPAIITEDEHQRVVAAFAARKRTGQRAPQRYLLSGGLLRCGKCGTRLYSTPREGRRRYGCLKGPDHRGCGRLFITAEPLEELVTLAVLYRLDTPELAQTINAQTEADHRAREVADIIEQTQGRLDDLGQMFAAGEISRREFVTMRTTIVQQQETAERRLATLTRTDALAGLFGTGRSLSETWHDLTLARQQAIIRALTTVITIGPGQRGTRGLDPNRVDIEWRV